jgi:hypothetical protein
MVSTVEDKPSFRSFAGLAEVRAVDAPGGAFRSFAGLAEVPACGGGFVAEPVKQLKLVKTVEVKLSELELLHLEAKQTVTSFSKFVARSLTMLPSEKFEAMKGWLKEQLKAIPASEREAYIAPYMEIKDEFLKLSDACVAAKSDALALLKQHETFLNLDDSIAPKDQVYDFVTLSKRARFLVSNLEEHSKDFVAEDAHLGEAVEVMLGVEKAIRSLVGSTWKSEQTLRIAATARPVIFRLTDHMHREHIDVLREGIEALARPFEILVPMRERLSAWKSLGYAKLQETRARLELLEPMISEMRPRVEQASVTLRRMFAERKMSAANPMFSVSEAVLTKQSANYQRAVGVEEQVMRAFDEVEVEGTSVVRGHTDKDRQRERGTALYCGKASTMFNMR